ncbi:MAG: hypothetical protein Q7Q71_14970 [Verrucomicrobiota bacterium JB023]|nr:hypothetical protein [Verrucomicrobiota bacterium JB023]
MKTKFFTLALSLVALEAGAFSIDFSGLNGTVVDDTGATVNIDGYGDVTFSTPAGQSISVGTFFDDTLAFEVPPASTLFISFEGAPVENFTFQVVGEDPRMEAQLSTLAANQYSIQVVNTSTDKVDGLGLAGFEANVVPEPSAALLGALGLLTLLRRRR